MRPNRVQVEKDIAKDKRRASAIRMRFPRTEHRLGKPTRSGFNVFDKTAKCRFLICVRFPCNIVHTITVVPAATVLPSSTNKLPPPKGFTSSHGSPLGAGPLNTEPSFLNFEP